jgi:hypothetical protein
MPRSWPGSTTRHSKVPEIVCDSRHTGCARSGCASRRRAT